MQSSATDIFMLGFVIFSMFGIGLALTVKEISEPIKNIKFVLLALIVNFLLIPIITYATCMFLNLDKSLFAGLFLLACCGGAPFLPKLTTLAGGNIALGVGLMILLMATTVVFAPIAIPLAIPGVAVNPWGIAFPLVFYMILPLIIGLVIKAFYPKAAGFIRPLAVRFSTSCLILMSILALYIAFPLFVKAFGTGVYNATALFVIGSIVAGYLFSGFKTHDKYVMAIGAGQRNIMAALLIAASNFPDRSVVTTVLIGSLVGFIILFPAAVLFGRLAK